MEFRLTYDGILLGDKKPRPDHKHHIRRHFHKQLARLWQIHPSLKGHPDGVKRSLFYMQGVNDLMMRSGAAPLDPVIDAAIKDNPGQIGMPMSAGEGRDGWFRCVGVSQIEYLAETYKVRGYRFVPLVRRDLALSVSIHVLFLRPGRPGTMLNAGDIDGRVKTLFDALQIPKIEQVKDNDPPGEGENPFFCLVDDDEQITHLSVETDTLLEPSEKAGNHPENDARLVITVKIHPYAHNPGNQGFG